MLTKQPAAPGRLTHVIFELAAGVRADRVHLVGDFNDWNKSITPMKRLKNGSFTATLYLRPDCEYEFRYLLDGITWENDPQADKYVSNVYGSENSVVAVGSRIGA